MQAESPGSLLPPAPPAATGTAQGLVVVMLPLAEHSGLSSLWTEASPAAAPGPWDSVQRLFPLCSFRTFAFSLEWASCWGDNPQRCDFTSQFATD